jgi:hypothetical protein
MLSTGTDDDRTNDVWKVLYNVGAVSALIVFLFIPFQVVVFFVWPPPDTVTGWFALFQKHPFVGLLDMDLLLTVDYLLLGLVFLALSAAFRIINRPLATLALMIELLAVTTYMASTAAFEMLTLSNGYAAATTDASRGIYLAAGETMMATWQGTAFNVSYVLGAVAVLILSFVMVRSALFSRATAYVGIAMGVMMLLPPTVGMAGVILSLLSLVPTAVWLVLIARGLWKLGHSEDAGVEKKQGVMRSQTRDMYHLTIRS